MADDLFTSSSLPEKETDLSSNIRSALSEIRESFPDQEIRPIKWNGNYVAIPLSLKIDLPTRGTVNNVDIRKVEPIFLLLHRKYYPYKAPQAWSNRRDFPKDRLPHLNPKPLGSAANFCLHRGSIDTWFSEHTILEYIQRIQEWLSDAASNRLMRDEDGFEATRIDTSVGYCIYEPSSIQEKIKDEWRNNRGGPGFSFLLYKLLNNSKKEPLISDYSSYTIQLEYPIQNQLLTKSLELIKKINVHYTEDNKIDRYLYGMLVWPPKNMIYDRFFADLPETLDQLFGLCNSLKIPLDRALKSYLSNDLQLFGGIPVTLVIQRPQKILYTNSTLELLNFVIARDNGSKLLIEKDTRDPKVWPISQRSPLTLKRARDISSIPSNRDIGKILFLGCGAIGSKLALHLVKCGQCQKITFVDFDDISPHNLVRHGLLNDSLGMNKAEAMKEVVEGIYYADKDSIKVSAIKDDILDLFLGKNHEILCQHSWLIDATASSTIRNVLLYENLPSSLLICRCELADNGKLGFMSIEGTKRNPRLDDILFFIFDLAIDSPEISNWLKSTKIQRDNYPNTILEEINIGISCNSETMRLADDSVSLHASLFSLGFRKYALSERHNDSGFLQISYNYFDQESRCTVQSYEILPTYVIMGENNKQWQIRVKDAVRNQLMQYLHQSDQNETGGLLIGQINSKKKIVYITRILPAPPDSTCGPYAFERGVLDVPEEVTKIAQLSGDMINYVGEWHTHPNGGKNLSAIDCDTVRKIKSVLDAVSRPTLIMIVTKNRLYPYIFP